STRSVCQSLRVSPGRPGITTLASPPRRMPRILLGLVSFLSSKLSARAPARGHTMAFTDQVVVVTGASDGIGAELARQLSAEKPRLLLAARSADRLEAVAADCRARGAQAQALPTDVTDDAQCRALVEQAVATYGGI